jgi:hypothetical protein
VSIRRSPELRPCPYAVHRPFAPRRPNASPELRRPSSTRSRNTPTGPSAPNIVPCLTTTKSLRSLKVEDNPLIYFLNHILNLTIYRCNIDAIWRFTCMILEIRYICVTKIEPRTMVSASPDPRARTQPRPRTTVSALPDPRARTQPRPRTTVSASPDPRGSDSTSTPDDGLHLARPPGPDSASTSEEPPPRPTSGSDRPRHRGGHHYPTPS